MTRPRPDFTRESAAGGLVAGVDEVGRGPLAGPVFAGAVIFPRGVPAPLAAAIDDSKRLDPARRASVAAAIRASGALWALGAASVAEIERRNVLGAALLAMRRAVLRLPLPPDFALIDGPHLPDLPCPARALVGGDGLSLSVAAAAILAKVARDRLMARLACRHPDYGWERNAGYGTAAHLAGLARCGASPHHRAGFAPVRAARLIPVKAAVPGSRQEGEETEGDPTWSRTGGR